MIFFRTVSFDVIRERLWFGIPDIKVSVVKRKKKFLMKYVNSANRLCQLFSVMRCQNAIAMCNFSFFVFLVIFLLFMVKYSCDITPLKA